MTDPRFLNSITNPFGLTDVGLFAAPTFADVDGDGDLDAFVGNFVGNTLFYRNTGSATNAVFAARANASKVLLITTKIKAQRKISISGLIYFPRLKAIAKIFVNK